MNYDCLVSAIITETKDIKKYIELFKLLKKLGDSEQNHPDFYEKIEKNNLEDYLNIHGFEVSYKQLDLQNIIRVNNRFFRDMDKTNSKHTNNLHWNSYLLPFLKKRQAIQLFYEDLTKRNKEDISKLLNLTLDFKRVNFHSEFDIAIQALFDFSMTLMEENYFEDNLGLRDIDNWMDYMRKKFVAENGDRKKYDKEGIYEWVTDNTLPYTIDVSIGLDCGLVLDIDHLKSSFSKADVIQFSDEPEPRSILQDTPEKYMPQDSIYTSRLRKQLTGLHVSHNSHQPITNINSIYLNIFRHLISGTTIQHIVYEIHYSKHRFNNNIENWAYSIVRSKEYIENNLLSDLDLTFK